VNRRVSVPRRFNGPRSSGNGGYSAGLVAGAIEGPAQVSLRRPVPLDRELRIEAGDHGARLVDGNQLIAEGVPAPDFDLRVPDPVSLSEATEAASHYRGLADGEFSECFVCGLARPDSFEVFAGQVPGRDLVATPWTPPDWTANGGGKVRPEFVWAVLDCPTFFAAHLGRDLTMSVLARLTARIDRAVRTQDSYSVMSWPLGSEGRKHSAGIAICDADGGTVAVGEALLIEPRGA
jgi:hypothetical protein